MKMFIIGGLLITLPALVVVLFFINRPLWIVAAVASLLINSLPFAVAAYLVHRQRKEGNEVELH